MSRPSRKAASASQSAPPPAGVRNLGKITPPTLQRVFGNERLFARLDAARFYPVVWLHGPPGAGKTTLAASYLAAKGTKPLWCRLDEGDSDPASVFLFLSQAAKLCAPDLDLPLLQPEFRTALPLFTRRFFRELFATSNVPVVVLDDYHEVAAGAALHDCLPSGLEEVPAGCQVIIISRSAPPSQLARLRLNGRIDVVEPDALRLNAIEIRALAHERDVDAPDLAEERIVSATQGWAAGVILMLEATKGNPLAPGGLSAPLPEVLFDYFAGEILQRMEPWAPAILATLALLPTMTAITAVNFTGRPEAGDLLEHLYRRNYFTTRDDAPEPRYRFHPLFRDFLRASSRRQVLDETLLKIRAAAILEEDGDADAAVHLLVETGQSELLAALVKRRAAALVEDGRNDTLFTWLSSLSREHIEKDAWLSHWRGAARVGIDPIDAYPYFMTSLTLFEAAEDVTGQFVAWIGAAEAIRFDATGDTSRFDPLIMKMRALLARHPTFPSPNLEIAVSASMATALSRRSAARADYADWSRRAREMARRIDKPAISIRLAYAFAIVDLLDGRFADATRALAKLPDPLTLDHLPATQWAGLVAKTIALAHRQDANDIEAFVVEAIKRLAQSGMVVWMSMLAAMVATRAFSLNDAASCDRWRARSADLAEKARVAPPAIYYTVAVGHKILIGDVVGALAEAETGIEAAASRGYRYFVAHVRLMRASALFAAKALDELAVELDCVDSALRDGMADSLLPGARLLRAAMLYEQGDEAAGRANLSSAMALGRRQDAKSVLIESRVLSQLCKRALVLDIEPAFVCSLIRSTRLRPLDPHDEAWPWPLRITTLGGLSIEIDGEPLVFSGKAPRRLIALVKAIAAYGGRGVQDIKIADALWPDEEADAALNSLSVATHRLRKLFGDNEAIVVSNGTIGFDPTRCWLDLWAFERKLDRRKPAETPDDFDRRIREGLALYRGDFLPDDDEAWWTAERRDALRKRYERALAVLPAPSTTKG